MSLIKKFEENGSSFEAADQGSTPNGALKAPNILGINDTFSKGQYLNNLPNDIDTDVERARAQDATA